MPNLIATPSKQDAYKWDATQLRVTIFPSPSFQPQSTITELLLGKVPSRSSSDNVQSIYTEETDLERARLNVMLQPSRIDLTLIPIQNFIVKSGQPFDATGNFILGPYNEFIKMMREMVAKWMSTEPAVLRIAFAPILQLPVADRITAYKTLAKFLPKLEIDGDKMSEILYRINRPRQIIVAAKPLRINRISTWSSLRFVTTFFDPETKMPKEVQNNTCACSS